jgi:hypothetical protein
VFRISGEGRVERIGEVWRISGRDFLTQSNGGPNQSSTEIIGNPRVGDWVSFKGRILPDGTYFADRIALRHRAQENTFSFTGNVDAIGAAEWTIATRAVQINAQTRIDSAIKTGDLVEVNGVINADGTLLAERIRLVDQAGRPFEFTGVVESIAGEVWTISGVSITTDSDTQIRGGPVVGDVVRVEGRILEDGAWLARSIRKAAEPEREFEFTGAVESIDPWVVAGIDFETDSETAIDEGIEIGDRVRVRGRVLPDGAWLATRIDRIDRERPRRFEFVGRVSSMNPWVVGGVTLEVDEDTRIDNRIAVGDLARVKGRILPDNTFLAERIRRVGAQRGCLTFSVVVTGVTGNRVTLRDGQVIDLSDQIQVTGDLKNFSVIIIRICISEDGAVTIISITVIHQLPPPAPPKPPSPPGGGGGDDDDDD